MTANILIVSSFAIFMGAVFITMLKVLYEAVQGVRREARSLKGTGQQMLGRKTSLSIYVLSLGITTIAILTVFGAALMPLFV